MGGIFPVGADCHGAALLRIDGRGVCSGKGGKCRDTPGRVALCAGAWRGGRAACGGAKRRTGRRGAVAHGGAGAQPRAALQACMWCSQRGPLCGTRPAHYLGLCVGGMGVWSWLPDLTVLVHSSVWRPCRRGLSGRTTLSRARAGVEGRCRDPVGLVQAMRRDPWCVGTLGRGGCGGGVGRGAAMRRPQSVSARQLRGQGGTAQCETRRRSVPLGSARRRRGTMRGRAVERGGDMQGRDGGLRRADVVGLLCGAERGFTAVLCRGCTWGCVRVQHVTALRGAAPGRCTGLPQGAKGRVGRHGRRSQVTEQLPGVGGQGGWSHGA